MQSERWRADRLDTRLAQGRLAPVHVCAVATALARRHAQAESRSTHAPALDEEIAALRDRLVASGHDAARLDAAHAHLAHLLANDRARFEARIARGAIRPIHGALGMDSVFVDARSQASIDEPAEPIVADTSRDVARLALSLRRVGRADLAERFVAAYAEASDDFALYPLLAFYEARAALDLATQSSDGYEASRWLGHARPSLPRARPQVVAVGGRAASGKSTIATRLAAELGAPLVSAHGVCASGGDEWSLFLALAERAAPVLDSGRSLVLDATFASQATRRAVARLARERGAPFLFTECSAYDDTRRRRLAARSPSPATSAATEWEPVRDLEGGVHVVVDTNRAEPRGFARVRRILPAATSLVA